jgi:hypothetical protein
VRAGALPRDAGAATDLATALILLHRAPEAITALDPVLPRLKGASPQDAVRVHAVRLAAGVATTNLGRDLARAWAAVPPGTMVLAPWDLLRRAAARDLPVLRRAGVDRVLKVLASPRDARSLDDLQRALAALT